MADGYLIGAEYLFKSNAQRELGAIAKYSAQAAEAIEALEKSTAGASEALAAFSRVGSQVRTVLESILPMADRIAVAFEAIGANLGAMSTGAERAAGKYDASVESMGASTTAFAAEADTAFTGVIARLEGVTAAARTASVSLRTVNRTGAASAAGAGAAATAGGGAAMRFAGSAAGVGGLAALATLAIGTKQRANLQDSMIQTGLAMGEGKVLPDGYVQKNLLPIAMRMSMNTAQSVTDSMNLLRTMATSGLNNPRDMAQLAMPIAQFADTQFLGKNHVPFEQSAAQMAALSHMLNLRTAAQLAPFMNTEYKISNDMPDSLKTMQTQIKYFGSSFVQAGVAPEEVLKLAARADRLGYGSGKSGTGLNMILRNLRSPSSDKMYAAQQGLGLLDAHGNSRVIDQAGHFDPEALFAALNQTRHQFGKGRGREYGQLLSGAFSTNASLIAGAFSSDTGIAQGKAVTATLARIPDLQTAQVRLMSSLNHQSQLLATNFATLSAILAGPLIAPLTHFVSMLSSATGGAATFLSTHPRESAVATGALTVGAGLGVVKLAQVLGGLRIFAHIAEHEARHSVGVGASVGIRRAGEHGAVRANLFEVVEHSLGKLGGPLGRFGGMIGDLAAKWLPRVTIGILGLETGIPEVLAALEAFREAFKLLFGGGGLDMVKQVRIWWEKNKAGIGYTIGYAFGTIGQWLSAAIKGLMSAAGTALAYAQSHWKDLLFDNSKFSSGLDAQLAAAMKANSGNSFLDYARAGAMAAGRGGPYDPSAMSYDPRNARNRGAATPLQTIPVAGSSRGPTTVNLNLPKGTPQQHAEQTIDILNRFWNGSSNAAASGSGSNRGSATGPRLGSSLLVPAH